MKINPNLLIKEKSPYLLQHSYNPVKWYPWGEEAFKEARRRDVPIFLSIGYSTCHWCHVMAHESFADQEVARFLNEHFVAIKVDREERPDIDAIYMEACVALNGSGGWPLNVFLDHEKAVFWAGAYYPKTFFLSILENIHQMWKHNRIQIHENAQKIHAFLTWEEETHESEIDDKIVKNVFIQIASQFDIENGGLKHGPKFPTPHHWLFLMKYHQIKKSSKALDMVEKTLIKMRKGGIFDQIGFGFCRYATDSKWLIPHFEKMLYDNAWLIISYLEAYKITQNDFYVTTAKQIAAYLTERMQSPVGGYYTAEDADSDNEEGAYYLFTEDEIDQILQDNASKFKQLFNVTSKGNFQGKNILFLGDNLIDFSEQWLIDAIEKVKQYQAKRTRPFRDEKILSSYNGVLLAGFAQLFQVTQDDLYLKQAQAIANFLQTFMIKGDKLMARYIEEEVRNIGFDEDYAYCTMGFIDLYHATLDSNYLTIAQKLMDEMINSFYDQEKGGFYQTDKVSEIIIKRQKQSYDGAIPSSNAIAINNLLRLYNLTEQQKYYNYAYASFKTFNAKCLENPLGYSYYAINVLYFLNGGTKLVLSGKTINEVLPFLKIIHQSKRPFITIVFDDGKTYPMLDHAPTVYLCENQRCLPPFNTLYELERVLKNE